MRKIQFITFLGIFFLYCILPSFAQEHRAGTSGPETPPLQGQGRWHCLAPLPHARGEVAVAEAFTLK